MKIFKKLSLGLNYILCGDCINNSICHKKFGDNIYKYNDFVLIKMTQKISDFESDDLNKDDKILENPLFIPYNYSKYQEFKEFIYLNYLPKIFNFTEFNKDLMISSLVYTILYIKGRKEEKTNLEISKILEKALNISKNKIKLVSILAPIHNKNEQLLMDIFRLEYGSFTTRHCSNSKI